MLGWESILRYLKDKVDAIKDETVDARRGMLQEPSYDACPAVCDAVGDLNTIRDIIEDAIEDIKRVHGMRVMPKSEKLKLQDLRYLRGKVSTARDIAKGIQQDLLRGHLLNYAEFCELMRGLDSLSLFLTKAQKE